MTKTDLKPAVIAAAIDDIKPYPKNAKIHDERHVEGLAESIRRHGWTSPIVVDRNMIIIAGHGRRLAALKLGLKKVPVIVRDDLDEAEADVLRLADNKASSTKYDVELENEELKRLLEDGVDLGGLKLWTEKELEFAAPDVDLGALADDDFVEDIAAAVDNQRAGNDEKARALDEGETPIVKVLGFTKVPGRLERKIKRLVMHIEATTGKTGPEALAAFADQVA